jgi:hypothetical protein
MTVLFIGVFIYGWMLFSRVGSSWFPIKLQVPSYYRFEPPSPFTLIVLMLIVLQVLILAMAVYQFTPNNWDSMTYHLARVVHWQQEQRVYHYATHIDRQIQLAPFAEFVIAHLHIAALNGL